jgi:dihydroorotate dehydrogenase
VLYQRLRPLLFRLDPETAHHLTLATLRQLDRLGVARLLAATRACAAKPRQVMGITFPNPVGLAAGMDKNGYCIDAWARLGFGFIEVGTVTPRPQPGNPRPRMFRVTESEAIINRMGFNNDGVEGLLRNLERTHYRGVLGINIGKNFDTPIERAADDYLHCLRAVYPRASYVTVNISSPNTQNLRDLQNADELDALLLALKTEQNILAAKHMRRVPLAVKIAPDLDAAQIKAIAQLLIKHEVEAVIATNTTLSREGVEGSPFARESGGLSGAPLRSRATEVIRQLARHLRSTIPIIGVGGILRGADAAEKIRVGASLVQIYSGLIYRGPELIEEICRSVNELESAAPDP